MKYREKIAEIIKKNGTYNGRSLSFDYYVVQPDDLATALIENGIGDIIEWKRRAEVAERGVEKRTAKICIILANQHENGKEIAKDIAEKFDIEVFGISEQQEERKDD